MAVNFYDVLAWRERAAKSVQKRLKLAAACDRGGSEPSSNLRRIRSLMIKLARSMTNARVWRHSWRWICGRQGGYTSHH